MSDGSMPDKEYLKSLTLLYVEDDEDTRKQFVRFLERMVGNLIVAKDGLEGLEAYRKNNPDIIMTDIMMPNMGGLEMAQAIRGDGGRLPIIILTAFEELDYLKRSINMGVDKYLTKPVKGFQLQETLIALAHELQIKETIQRAVSTDPLTGLINRRELEKKFESEKSRVERHGTVFSLMMVDIDHFKKVNDTFGHIAGDLILKSVANTITSAIRLQDVCGRWGGEEFLIILPETDLDAAAQVAEKLRSAVSNVATVWEGTPISVTISLGIEKFRQGMTMNECIKSADDAMYRAKIGGRNRVERAAD